MHKGSHADMDQPAKKKNLRLGNTTSIMMTRIVRTHIHLHHIIHGILTSVKTTESALGGCEQENVCPGIAYGSTKFRLKPHSKSDHPLMLA